jgi:hypothetical protein
MPEEAFCLLVEMAEKLLHFLFFVSQPAFILSLGIGVFSQIYPVSLYDGNFSKVLNYCKDKLLRPNKIVTRAISAASSYIQRTKNFAVIGLCLGTCCVVALGAFSYFFKEPALPQDIRIKNSDRTERFNFSFNRAGGQITEATDKLADLLAKARAEFSVVTGFF